LAMAPCYEHLVPVF